MVINSGIVLDYVTNFGVSEVKVLALSSSGTTINSNQTNPYGIFSVDIGNYIGDITYIPVKESFIGLTKRHKSYVPWIDLYLINNNSVQESGVSQVNNYNLPLSTSSKIRSAVSNKANLYVITEGGLDIVDLNTYTNVGYVNYSGGFTTIDFYNTQKVEFGVLLGTTNSGACEFLFPTNYSTESRDLTSLLKTKFKSDSLLYDLQSDKVNCISRNYFNEFVIGTESGIDYYSRSGVHYYHNYGNNIETNCCYITDSGDVYYSPTNSGLYVKYGPIIANWDSVDYIISLTGIPSFNILTDKINSIDVKTISGENYVYLATQSGLLWYKDIKTDLNLTASGARLYNNI
jgi:hypothetical protein